MKQAITEDKLRDLVDELKGSANKHRNDLRPARRRFGVYRYLKDIYRVYLDLRSKRIARKATRRIAKRLQLSCQNKAHPIRILIEASAGAEDNRAKSRWTQALLYAFSWKETPKRLQWFFELHGGISGAAAKLAALHRANKLMVTNRALGAGLNTPKINTAAISDTRS